MRCWRSIEDDRVDLVVMGAVARGALKRLFPRQYRRAGVRGADLRSVLIVKPAESFVCPVEPA
jgi:nucleotide-binding universal stress UspA family protein